MSGSDNLWVPYRFAYGQTGSGKTHTMNNVMDRVAVQLLSGAANQEVRFSYLEILGNALTDTLRGEGEGGGGDSEPEGEVKMGELVGLQKGAPLRP